MSRTTSVEQPREFAKGTDLNHRRQSMPESSNSSLSFNEQNDIFRKERRKTDGVPIEELNNLKLETGFE
jgi:hypothetical protein